MNARVMKPQRKCIIKFCFFSASRIITKLIAMLSLFLFLYTSLSVSVWGQHVAIFMAKMCFVSLCDKQRLSNLICEYITIHTWFATLLSERDGA